MIFVQELTKQETDVATEDAVKSEANEHVKIGPSDAWDSYWIGIMGGWQEYHLDPEEADYKP